MAGKRSKVAAAPAAGLPAGPFDWPRFLGRPAISIDRELASEAIAGRCVLITGAGGSIGSALSLWVAEFAPREIVLLDASRTKLGRIEDRLANRFPGLRGLRFTAVHGNICDPLLLRRLFRIRRPEIVFHAAALKHVPPLERNPFAAMRNNALGTAMLARVAEEHGAERFVFVSTDKAADPHSALGASKRIAELALLAPGSVAAGSGAMQRRAVRLVNVLGSSGSVVPLFLRQIRRGGPVTVTHRQARRYFLPLEETIALLLYACAEGAGEGILVPQPGRPVTVARLARFLIRQTAGPRTVPIAFTALRPGDKVRESLISRRERYCGEAAGVQQFLRRVNSPALPESALDALFCSIREACRRGSREKLLDAVLSAVPEYRPSRLMRSLPA